MPSDIRCEAESMVTKRLELLDYIFAPLKNQDEILMVYCEELSRFNTAKLIEAKRGFFLDAKFRRRLIRLATISCGRWNQ